MFNAVEIYARQFKPIEGGYLYHPARWSRGYLVNESEFRQLRANWERVAGWQGLLKLLGVVFLITALASFVGAALDLSEATFDGISFLIAVGIVAYLGWEMSAAYRLVRSREPYAPRRSGREADGDIAARISWPMAATMVVLSLWFCFIMILATLARPLIGLPLLALFGTAAFMNMRIVLRKWASRSQKT